MFKHANAVADRHTAEIETTKSILKTSMDIGVIGAIEALAANEADVFGVGCLVGAVVLGVYGMFRANNGLSQLAKEFDDAIKRDAAPGL